METIDFASLDAKVQNEIMEYPEDLDLIFFVNESGEVDSVDASKEDLLEAQGGMGEGWRRVEF